MAVVHPINVHEFAREKNNVVRNLIALDQSAQIQIAFRQHSFVAVDFQKGTTGDKNRFRVPQSFIRQSLQRRRAPVIIVELEGQEFSPGKLNPFIQSQGMNARIALMAHVDNSGIEGAESLYQIESAVSRAVVDDEQFPIREALLQNALDRSIQQPDCASCESRQDD